MLKDNVRRLRIQRGITQTELARAADVSTQTLNNIEKGRSQGSPINLAKLAGVLGVSIEELMGVDIPKAPAPLRSLPKKQRRDLLELVAAKHLPPLPGELRKLMQIKSAAVAAGMSGGMFDIWFRTYAVEDVRDELLPEEGATLEEVFISSR